MATERSSVVRPLIDDLQRIFANRLDAVVVYGRRRQGPVPTLALVGSLTMDDLNACAERSGAWRRAGAAIPLLLTRSDFIRSFDAFPIEYGEILERHDVVFGSDPFDGLTIKREDRRRACEVQVKSHLLHLREDYLESGGRHSEIDELVRESAPGFSVVLRQIARLDGVSAESAVDLIAYASERVRLDPHVVGDLLAISDGDGLAPFDTVKAFPAYLAAMERLSDFVDQWREA
jgi:hypothetical protein